MNPVEVVLTLEGRGDTGEVVRADVLWEDAVVAGAGAGAHTHGQPLTFSLTPPGGKLSYGHTPAAG